MSAATQLAQLETPALLLDPERLERNIERMRLHLIGLGGVGLRPHVKTVKSIDIIRRALRGQMGGITVSTLKEAEYFLENGISDILYAVGIAPRKLAHVADLIRRGAQLSVVVDNIAAAQSVAATVRSECVPVHVLIELDVDGHRSGVRPESQLLLEVGRYLHAQPGVSLDGVMTHAGESYNCRSVEEIRSMAERERAGAVLAADRLRAAGMAAPVVSVGSTPTATFAANLTGVTEVRAGVYLAQDLVMAGLGVCTLQDIALSVLVTVIGHQPERGWIITDGGWMAMSRDRGTARQPVDQGYGVVCDVEGDVLADDLIVTSANQEHGVVAQRHGNPLDLDQYPVGRLLRILPNHACATGAQHSEYCVLQHGTSEGVCRWPRVNGW